MKELFEIMIEIIPFAIILTRRADNKIIYINNKTEEYFRCNRQDMLGTEAPSYYYNKDERNTLLKDINNNIPVKDREITYKRKDGTFFLGSITMVVAQYFGQEVLLSCISDITKRKQIEEEIQINNEKIEKMNLKLLEINHELKNRSIRDGLTKLYNHQYINELLEKEIKIALIGKYNLCLLMMDIDLFKHVNDNYGHQVGDHVLTEVARLISKNVRSNDLVGRYGGEEFIVVLPDINIDNAYKIAERIRLCIQDYNFGVEGLRVTISIGLTQFDMDDGRTLVNRSDNLLYQAKNNGRNRVEMD